MGECVRWKLKNNGAKRIGNWFSSLWGRFTERGRGLVKRSKLEQVGDTLRKKIPPRLRQFDIDFEHIDLKNIQKHSTAIRWGLVVLGVFLLAQIAAALVGLFIRPTPLAIPKKPGSVVQKTLPREGYDFIEQRNIFNVEGTIPEPFESGLLECMSQAKPSNEPLVVLGTIVMNDDRFSTALIQRKNDPLVLAAKKDDWIFDNKYLILSIERKRICFQVQQSQEMEYIEIPDELAGLESAGSLRTAFSTTGIKPISETTFEVKKSFLDEKLLNLNEILQTARAVPYVDPGSGQFKGFLVQTVDPDSPFAELGIRQGDILTGVNDIKLDSAGRGLEAFQRLRNATKITLQIIRGGQSTTLDYTLN